MIRRAPGRDIFKTYTSINDTDLDTRAHNALGVEQVNLGHDMGREGVVAGLPLDVRDELGAFALVDDLVVGQRMHSHWPYLLDTGQGQQVGGLGLGSLEVAESDGRALEEGRVKLHLRVAERIGLAEEAGRVLIGQFHCQSFCFVMKRQYIPRSVDLPVSPRTPQCMRPVESRGRQRRLRRPQAAGAEY